MFGPFWRLTAGAYRLRIDAKSVGPHRPAYPVLAVEIIADNRHQLIWRDFTGDELAAGAVVDFQVPDGLGAKEANAGFEFRISYQGAGGCEVSGLTLERLETPVAVVQSRWRLMGLLYPFPYGYLNAHRTRASTVVWRSLSPLPVLRTPRFVLPDGRFELRLKTDPVRSSSPQAETLVLCLRVWRGGEISRRVVRAGELAAGTFAWTVDVAPEIARSRVTFPVILEIFSRRGRVALRDVELVRLDAPPPTAAVPLRVRVNRGVTGKMVAIGNCQVETLAYAFERSPHLARRMTARHYRPDAPAHLLDLARRDMADCNVVLIQDIAEFEASPLKDEIPERAQIIRVPCLHLASLWPFDHYNGPTDFKAFEQENPNFTFVSLDGLLGRLRQEVPDPEARLAAYAALDGIDGVVDVARLHRFEARRLLKMDAHYGFEIGAEIVENFRVRRLFHTTAHPGGRLLNMLLRHVTGQIGKAEGTFWLGLNHLSRDQVPVHPLLARRLGVGWATERTKYARRGRKVTWEDYTRAYIAHYG